jgi:hypothetical protein
MNICDIFSQQGLKIFWLVVVEETQCKYPNTLILFQCNFIKESTMRLARHAYIWGRGEVHTAFWCGNLTERDNLKDPSADRRVILMWILKEED